jgi:LmbE family N-acetylglucosaminyl deacetylase
VSKIRKNILVFAPHPDDETLGCGGTIAKKLSEGYEVVVVILTDGRHAFSKVLGITSNPTPEELKQIRKEEAMKALNVLGVPKLNMLFLDFEDGSLENRKEEAKGKILEIIKKYQPTEVYYSHSKDHNPDHKVTNSILKECIKIVEPAPKSLQYSIMQKYAKIGPLLDKLISLFKKHIIEVDVSEFVHLKKKAIEQYKSQISIISKDQTKVILSEKRIKKYLGIKEFFYQQ